jgi:hypothetical protein
MKKIYVIKMNGEKELYNEKKLIRSLKNAGADNKTIKRILIRTERILYSGIKTKVIFRFVFEQLKKIEKSSGIKYSLKQGIIDLGVDGGYAFEKFMARVLEKQGYETELNKIVKGEFIEHEIDVIAKKGKEKIMVETKHFSKPWLGMNIQTALYVYARFLDVKTSFNKAMLATNTKFSPQVIEYSKGVGIKLIGWKYPKENSLEDVIKKHKIYPITILPISKNRMRRYLERNVIIFEDILKEKDLPNGIREEIEKILKS